MSWGIRLKGVTDSGREVTYYDSSEDAGEFFMVLDVFTVHSTASGSKSYNLPSGVQISEIDCLVYAVDTSSVYAATSVISVSGNTLYYSPGEGDEQGNVVIVVTVK